MKTKLLITLGIILVSCETSVGSRVLFLFPTPSKSHVMVAQGLSTTLAQKGHDVTFVSSYPLSKPMKNYRDIISPMSETHAKIASDMLKNPNQSMFKRLPESLNMIREMSDEMIELPEFKKLLKEEIFDLVIIGMFFNNYLLGFGEYFQCPTMMLSAGGAFTITNMLVGNPLAVSAVPHFFAPAEGKMSFSQRTKGFLIYSVDVIMSKCINYLQKRTYNKYFSSSRYISYDDALKNLSMILLNDHFTQGHIRPYVPAMVEVGGLQIKPKPDPLPSALKDWLDGAKNGAIFFSLGSNAKTTYLPKEKVDLLLKVFSKLKQRVVMKWESDELEGKPDNVFIGKWLPQDDILAHKNVQLFISHCGLGSTVESKYHGVPIVAVPLFGDQLSNAETVVSEGWGVKVSFVELSEKLLSDGINEVLNNSKYSSTVKRISELYKDRPLKARETATFWVEYVIRHRGAPHLQYNEIHLNFFQSNSLDVVAFLIGVAYVSFKLSVRIFKFILSKIFKSSKEQKANTKKQN